MTFNTENHKKVMKCKRNSHFVSKHSAELKLIACTSGSCSNFRDVQKVCECRERTRGLSCRPAFWWHAKY